MERRRRLTSVLALAALALLPGAAPAPSRPADAASRHASVAPDAAKDPPALAGAYIGPPGPARTLLVTRLDAHMLMLRGERWVALGFYDGTRFEGRLRAVGADGAVRFDQPQGALVFVRRDDGTLEASVTLGDSTQGIDATWKPTLTIREVPPGMEMVPPPSPPLDPDAPAFGEYVYVEELPEAIERPAPRYPDAARRGGIEGLVMVQALVRRDGAVGDTRVVKSVPGLDDAAVEAVRRWRFKPALAKGEPVAVWVAVPVTFKLR